jgi:hypothetical protein
VSPAIVDVAPALQATAGAGGSPGRWLDGRSWACAPPFVPRSPCMQQR